MVTLRFALLILALPLLGAWARMLPDVRKLVWPGRAAIYFAMGVLTVVAEMFALSLFNAHWNAWLLVPLPAALALYALRFRPTAKGQRPTSILLIAAAALALLVSAILAGAATSGDYAYFWGVKGQRWGAVHALDTAFTIEPSHYMHPDYPPLLPLTYAWTLLGGDGAFDWWGGALLAAVFLATGAAALWALGRHADIAMTDAIVTMFVAMFALFYVRNQVAGNAEPPLHMFECIALAALTCWRDRSGEHDLLAALALSGVALTKVEGGVFVILVCGTSWMARDGTLRARFIAGAKMAILPITTLIVWLVFASSRGLTDTYVPRHDLSLRYVLPTLRDLLRELSLHLGYTPWIAIAVILVCGRIRNAIPYVVATLAFLAFLLAVYTHPDPHLEWSAGRTLMTPLLLFIFAAVAAHRNASGVPVIDAPSGREPRS